jgi:hypothetical protein
MEENVFSKEWWSETLDLDESHPETTNSPYHNLVLSAMNKIEKTSMVFNVPIPDIQYAFETGKEVVLSDEMWKDLENSKSYNIKSLDDAIQHSLKLGIDPKPYIDYIKQGKEIPLPLILNYGPGKNYLIGGEVILSLYRALGSIPTALQGVLNLQMHGRISPPITEGLDKKKLDEGQITMIKNFIKYAAQSLELKKLPNRLTLSYDTTAAREKHTFGYFDPNNNAVWLYVKNRNIADILRTLAHELVHRKQDEEGRIDYESGNTGSEIENEANAQAGVLLREFGKINDSIYEGLKKNIKINEVNRDIKFIKPNFEEEWGEAERYPELFPNKKAWNQISATGKEQTVDCSMNINNTDMCDGSLEDLAPAKVARAKEILNTGIVELPIVLKIGDEYELLGGNTRLTALKTYGYPTKAWVINIEELYYNSKKDTLNEIGEDLSSAYQWEYKGGYNPTYTFSTGETKYRVIFRNEEGGTYERVYAPIKKGMKGTMTGEGKAIPINATVMAITLDFMAKNQDWYIITIHPIDPRRYKLVGNFLYKNVPLDQYNVEEIEGVYNITRKTNY